MKKYIGKNSIISFILLIAVISMPLGVIPKKAKAQSYGGVNLSGAIEILPLCRDAMTESMDGLFNGVGDLFSDDPENNMSEWYGDDLEGTDIMLSDEDINTPWTDITGTDEDINTQASAALGQEGVLVFDKNTAQEVKKLGKKVTKVDKNVEDIKNKDSCLDGLGRLLAKIVLQKITLSTVAWINSGFEGEPTFVKNPGKFFEDIAKNEILTFGVEISGVSPFSKDWLKNQVRAYNRKFADNAQYSLNDLIQRTTPQYTAETFNENFNQGGWDAWSYLTQVPANNPLGAQLLFSNELQKRLEGTNQSNAQNVRDALNQATGFLGDERCIDPDTGKPNGVTKAEHNAALRETPPRILCPTNQWQYVTPGGMVAQAATDLVGYPKDAFLDVEDLNDAVATVLDAIIGHFATKWMSDGLASLEDDPAIGTGIAYSGPGLDYESQIDKDFSPVHKNTSSWLRSNPRFNIRTDLSHALIDEQRTYIDKLTLQNKELLSTTDGEDYKLNEETGLSNAYGLIPTINQLDFCIPGPHPGWEIDSRRALNAAMDEILPETQYSLQDKDLETVIATSKSVAMYGAMAAGAAIGSAVPVLGALIGAVAGAIIGFIIDMFAPADSGLNVRAYYATVVASYTGRLPNYNLPKDELALTISSKPGFMGIMNQILDRYIDIMNETYFSSPDYLPPIAGEATIFFNKLPGYRQLIANNEEKIAEMNTIVGVLREIKEKVDYMNSRYMPDSPNYDPTYTEVQYEEELKEHINAFGRISTGMVNGNDIANADNIYKQIIDNKNYIYNNLIKGEYGCETFLEKEENIINFPQKLPQTNEWYHLFENPNRFITAKPKEQEMFPMDLLKATDWNNYNINTVRRAEYPFEIIYDYNHFPREGSLLPDPWNNPVKYQNKTPKNLYNYFGPGFLSFVFFGSHAAFDRTNILKMSDIFPAGNDEIVQHHFRAVGNRNDVYRHGTREYQNDDLLDGIFEDIIGIY